MVFSPAAARKVAEYLLQIKAIKIQPDEPFTWASGWRSPIYCDNRVTLSHPAVRTFIKEQLVALIRKNFKKADLIAGVATAGIAQGALVSDAMNLPFVYVRPQAKQHGMGKQLEGEVKKGQRAVLIEDLISTGKSSLAAMQPLRNAGCRVLGVAATFDYGFDIARENFQKSKCAFYSLSDYEYLLKAAVDMKYITNGDLAALKQWRKKPAEWGQQGA